jgi:hypothetical protein
MDEEYNNLKEKISQLSDGELVKMVMVEAGDYRKEALDLAHSEMKKRGIDPSRPSVQSEATAEGAPEEMPHCSVCGGAVRAAMLMAEREVTVVFADSEEQRFLNLNVCTQCGRAEFVVDLESEVEG